MALVINPLINGNTLAGGGNWTNSDGLTIYYGSQEAWLAPGGVFADPDVGSQVTDYLIDLAALVTANPTQVSRDAFPVNYIIEKVQVFVETVAASSGTGTLNIGLWNVTAGSTVSDTAIVAAMTTAIMTGGALITVILNPAGSTAFGSTYAGTKIGITDLAVAEPFTSGSGLPSYLVVTAKAGTAVFQSGIVRLRVFARRSLASDTTNSPGGQD